jgi:hypothetical protein
MEGGWLFRRFAAFKTSPEIYFKLIQNPPIKR